MNAGPAQLRAAITGLAGHAATEEELLLAAAPAGETGGPDRWAAVPLIAHNTEFKRQQAIRLAAVAAGTVPPAFGDIDHGSAEVYQRCAAVSAAAVAAASRQATADLLDGLAAVTDADLTDPARHPWLAGSCGSRSSSGPSGIRWATSVTITWTTASRAGPRPCRRTPWPRPVTWMHPGPPAAWRSTISPVHRPALTSRTRHCRRCAARSG